MGSRKQKIILAVLGALIGLGPVHAQADSLVGQLHFRTGMINSTIASSIGATGGAIAVAPSFDVEYERFRADRNSFFIRGTVAYEMATTVTRYIYGGVGQRYYLNARGGSLMAMTPELSVMIQPKFRYYAQWDAGVSQIVLNVLTASLQSFTTAIDGGGAGGGIYQMSDNFGIEGSLGVSYAFGFSSVPAAGMVMKILFGVAYSY